jgi:hypothetical protein
MAVCKVSRRAPFLLIISPRRVFGDAGFARYYPATLANRRARAIKGSQQRPGLTCGAFGIRCGSILGFGLEIFFAQRAARCVT